MLSQKSPRNRCILVPYVLLSEEGLGKTNVKSSTCTLYRLLLSQICAMGLQEDGNWTFSLSYVQKRVSVDAGLPARPYHAAASTNFQMELRIELAKLYHVPSREYPPCRRVPHEPYHEVRKLT